MEDQRWPIVCEDSFDATIVDDVGNERFDRRLRERLAQLPLDVEERVFVVVKQQEQLRRELQELS